MEIVGEYNTTTHIPFYGMVRRQASADIPPHDIYLGRLAEEGVIGAILQFWFYLLIFRAFVRRWQKDVWSSWFNKNTLVLFGAMMIVYLVGGMVIDYRYFDLVNVLFYMLAGLVYGFDPTQAEDKGVRTGQDVVRASPRGSAA